jgi:hypothetical protein
MELDDLHGAAVADVDLEIGFRVWIVRSASS